MTDTPFDFEIGDLVMMNKCCEFAEVIARLDRKGQEPLYQVEAYSAIDGQLGGWYKEGELTI